jgi:hypothetical protein
VPSLLSDIESAYGVAVFSGFVLGVLLWLADLLR